MNHTPIELHPYSPAGHIAPETNPQVREFSGGRIIKMSVGGADNNVYLVQCSTTGRTLLIDAANDADRIIELVDQETGGQLDLVATTHQHIDHWWALSDVVNNFHCPTAAHPLDATEIPVPTTRPVDDADVITVGALAVTAAHLRGHTPGSVAFILTDDADVTHIFSGDSLFPGGLGKTATPTEFSTLLADTTTKLFAQYPDNSIVYPGHGDDTTLGTERPHLGEWRNRGW